jgi:hypothetical protein
VGSGADCDLDWSTGPTEEEDNDMNIEDNGDAGNGDERAKLDHKGTSKGLTKT